MTIHERGYPFQLLSARSFMRCLMSRVSGNLQCQAAVFVYKGDNTALHAYEDARQIGHVRAEQHEEKSHFLAALRIWNSQASLEPENAYLGIYAHMGQEGIAPVREGPDLAGNIVLWQDLAAALPNRVQTCWLVGCTSDRVLKVWSPATGPIIGRLLVTEASEPWMPLVRYFAEEICMDPIRYPDEMKARLLKVLPTLGGKVEYYEPSATDWQVCFPQ